MAAQTGSHRVGPENASLKVKTYREGLASKAGHDLIIEVTRWEATLAVGEDGTTTSIELSADPASLIDKKVLGTDPISFTGSGGAAPNGRLPVSGDLTMAGTTRSVSFELETGHDGRIRATCSLSQSEWGIKPYSGLMGTLKVRDSVDLVAESG